MRRRHEVVIIGGGISGATAAFYLASLGHDVAVLERAQEAHHKVCGEFISGESLFYLEEMNLDLDKWGARTVSRFKLHSNSRSSETELPLPGRGFSRYLLDNLLLKQAETAGAQIYKGTNVRDVFKVTSSYSVKTSGQDFEAKVIFLATGKHALKKLHVRKGKGQDFIGFKYHLRLPQAIYQGVTQNVELFSYPGGYAGIVPIEDSLINLCFLLEKNRYKVMRARRCDLFSYILTMNAKLVPVLENAKIVAGPFAISQIPYGFIYNEHIMNDDIFKIGDQFAVISSLAGDGMAIAFYTGKKAAMYYHEYGLEGVRSYHKEAYGKLKKGIFLGFAVQQAMRFSVSLNVSIILSNLFPQMINRIFEETRTPACEASYAI